MSVNIDVVPKYEAVDKYRDEIWKDIIGSKTYQVSNYGRVKNKITDYILKPQLLSETYYGVRVDINGITKTVRIHCLVTEAFLGPRPYKYDINHIDGNKLNNRLDNLEYCSKSDNVRHAYKTGL